MSIQELSMTNNQKKALQKAINNENILILEENGDIVINVSTYIALKNNLSVKSSEPAPIEALLGDDALDFSAEYFVIS